MNSSTTPITAAPPPPSTSDEEIIYTDGSCLSQHNKATRRAGYAVNFGAGDARNVSEPIEGGNQTNQIGELLAVVVALERSTPGKRVTIYSDSHYVIRGLVGMDGEPPWFHQWLCNGWRNAKRKPVKHRDLWERAIAAGANRSFKLLYSKAHSGIAGNEAADRMARAGAAKRGTSERPADVDVRATKKAKCDCKATICNDGCARMPDESKQ
jgi:ribonuclease HI